MLSLRIKVKPGSSKDEISLDAEGTLVVKIKEKPIEGAANDYLVKFLAKEFGLSKNSVVLEKGATAKFKKIGIHIEEEQLNMILRKYRK